MTRTQLQEIMVRAHEIARTCEGDYAAGLSYGLRQAWAEYRLIQLGSRWQKAGFDRIYFNNLAEWYGLECGYYNTGNISWATLDGEKISNNSARKIGAALGWGKVWYDMNTGRFEYKNLKDEHTEVIISRIRAAARVA
jgi:hypothetical protein